MIQSVNKSNCRLARHFKYIPSTDRRGSGASSPFHKMKFAIFLHLYSLAGVSMETSGHLDKVTSLIFPLETQKLKDEEIISVILQPK